MDGWHISTLDIYEIPKVDLYDVILSISHAQGLIGTGICGDPITALDLFSYVIRCILTEIGLLHGVSFMREKSTNSSLWLAKGREHFRYSPCTPSARDAKLGVGTLERLLSLRCSRRDRNHFLSFGKHLANIAQDLDSNKKLTGWLICCLSPT